MNNNIVVLTQEVMIDDIKNNLQTISSRMIPSNGHIQSLLKGLSVQIAILVKLGFSFDQISDMFKICDVSISSKNILEFFLVEQLHRVSNIESNYEQKLRQELHGSSYLFPDLENELVKSIFKNQDLFLTYQPQINVTTGKIIGAEALVRWRYKGAVIHPGDFIEIAERSDLIHDLGDWIINEACREAKRWDSMSLGGDAPIKISVNLSVKQLHDDLPEKVHAIIRKNGTNPESIGIEITESFMLRENSIPILKKFKDAGISLSIDDFGTGYSCLAELNSFPFDVIKIDRSFVQNIDKEYRSSMMIESIVDLAQKFEMTTLAEGVETPSQVKILRNLGCNVCQGFHFSEPLTGNNFIRFVDQGISELHL